MKSRRGFSLVEVTMAIGIFAFVIVAVLALYSVALDLMGKSQHELQTANLMTRVVDDYRRVFLRQEPSAFDLPDPASLVVAVPVSGEVYMDELGRTAESTAAAYRLRYRMERLAGEDPSIRVHLTFSWPANASNPPVGLEAITVISNHL